MKASLSSIVAILLFSGTSYAFLATPSLGTTRSATILMGRRARGMGKSKNKKQGNTGTSIGPPANWVAIPGEAWDLSKLEEGKVKMMDTNLITLTDKLTNPDGAVSVLQQNGETFCFSSYCPSCKIPLSKAHVLGDAKPSPLIACSFCGSVYDLRSGKKTESEEAPSGGLFTGLAKNLFQASGNMDPMTIYPLGEKDGKTFIGLDQ